MLTSLRSLFRRSPRTANREQPRSVLSAAHSSQSSAALTAHSPRRRLARLGLPDRAAARLRPGQGPGALPGRPDRLAQEPDRRANLVRTRIIAITTDYVVGDTFSISSPNRALNHFISLFWRHPKNRLDLRLESMCDELARAGDLFVLLFRNDQDGMSYIRFVTKDQISRIETAANDWETELVYSEQRPNGEVATWLSPAHPDAATAPAIMLHYAVNRPLGALLGESDLTTLLPWLQRYSRMLEDRVRLHWAVRSFLWLVTVPANKILEKKEQYRTPPDTGSIIVKDESESWQAINPQMHGSDASKDLSAVRMMIDAGSGFPPHWRGEAADANLATAMQGLAERHLLPKANRETLKAHSSTLLAQRSTPIAILSYN